MQRIELENAIGIEGRAPISGQTETRQTYLGRKLIEAGKTVIFVAASNPESYNDAGRITRFQRYGNVEEVASPGGLILPTWRLRDPVFSQNDPEAYPDGRGYNTQLLRKELQTRKGVEDFLAGTPAIEPLLIPYISPDQAKHHSQVFVKPNRITDISENKSKRARLVRGKEIEENVGPNDLIQPVYPTIPASELTRMFNIQRPDDTEELPIDTFSELRIYNPLWLPYDAPAAIELQIHLPEAVGTTGASEKYLIDSEDFFHNPEMTSVKEAHQTIHEAFAERYNQLGYPAVKYLIGKDLEVKVTGVMARPFTPSLEQEGRQQTLALVTGDVEVKKLLDLSD